MARATRGPGGGASLAIDGPWSAAACRCFSVDHNFAYLWSASTPRTSPRLVHLKLPTRRDFSWLHFSLDIPLIYDILTFVDYCVSSAGACSRFSFSGTPFGLFANRKQPNVRPLESTHCGMQFLSVLYFDVHMNCPGGRRITLLRTDAGIWNAPPWPKTVPLAVAFHG